ncbi:MAG: hypothetical protein J5842_07395 [Lachnospiraceae bacterium]|nr:hypothetical protein [Lachnospiraceae bacterium]
MPDIYVFSKSVYGIKLEDQYWGLYLVAVLIGFAVVWKKYGAGRILPLYGVFSFFPFFASPLFYLTAPLFRETYKYEELSHAWLYPVLLPLIFAMIPDLVMKCSGEDKKKNLRVLAGIVIVFFIALCWAGDPMILGLPEEKTEDVFFASDEKKAYDMILEDAQLSGIEQPVIWADAAFMAKSRIYDIRILPLYGKDITEHPEKYSPELVSLKETFDLFEEKADHVKGKEDQIGAVANALNLYEGIWCDYVVIDDPALMGADVDSDSIFEQLGYVTVGDSGGSLIYRRTGDL